MIASTLWPGNCPPSPGLAPCAILICIMSELTRYSVVTPKRPEATCLIAERIESPFGSGLKRSDSSPPSPVLDLPPIRFIAIAKCRVRLARDRAEAHRAGGETLDDVLGGFDLVELDRLALLVLGGLDPEQAAQRQQPLGLLVEDFGERLVALERIAARGMLQHRDGFGGPGVILAAGAVGIFAADIERGLVDLRVAERVASDGARFPRRFRPGRRLRYGCGCRRNIWRRSRPSGRRRQRSARRNRTGRSRCPSWTSPSSRPLPIDLM